MTTRPRQPGASAPTHGRRGIQIKAGIGPTNIPGAPEAVPLSIDELTIDPEIQQRARVDEELVVEYSQDIAAWIDSAPIIVFSDGNTRWIADGFQRCAASIRAGLYAIPAIKIDGTRADALRYALGANATHGRRRGREDLERAYQTAVREGFCQATDTECVAELLKCSKRWASELTKEAREAASADRDANIRRLAEEGNSVRQIAEELGIPKSTVARAVPKRNSSEMGHPTPVDPVPATDHAQGDTEPVIVEEVEGDDLSGVRTATSKLQAEVSAPVQATPTPNPASAPATPAPKGPTAKEAMATMLQVTGWLGKLSKVEGALLEQDAKTLIKELRRALERLVGRFEKKEAGA